MKVDAGSLAREEQTAAYDLCLNPKLKQEADYLSQNLLCVCVWGKGGTTTDWDELVGAHRKKRVLQYGPGNAASFLIKGKPSSSRVHGKESRKEIPRGLKGRDTGRLYYYEQMCFGL